MRLISHKGIDLRWMRVAGVLDLTGVDIRFPISATNCAFTESIVLRDARLRLLRLDGCQVKDIAADRMKVEGAIMLRHGFESRGEIRLSGATIGGNLECDGAKFSNPEGRALNADGVRIDGGVLLRDNFTAEGDLEFVVAVIAKNLDCRSAQLHQTDRCALGAVGATIGGGVFLRDGFKAIGEVKLLGASVGRSVECDGGDFSSLNSPALNLDGAIIEGAVFLRDGFKAFGEVRLTDVTIGRSLQIRNVVAPEDMVLNLRVARAGTFWDDELSWPRGGNLSLDGFRYDRLFERAPVSAKQRIKWLQRQTSDRFLPQPYEQVARVLREHGHERDARTILIEKNRARARFTRPLRQGWWWYNVFGRFIGYGYAPWRAFAMSVVLISFGAFLFGFGSSSNVIAPTKETAYQPSALGIPWLAVEDRPVVSSYPAFNAVAYSVESFIPLIKLDQREHWAPRTTRSAQLRVGGKNLTITGAGLRSYLWFHIVAGWVLTTLWIGAVTGLVKT